MKLFAFVCGLLLTVSSLFAQKFEGGIFTGICGSQVGGDNYSGFNKAGFIIGGLVRRPVSEKWNLQIELLYVQKGSRFVSSDSSKADFYQIKVNYIEIPFLAQYVRSEKLLFEVGPSFGVLTYSQEENLYGIIPGQKPFKTTEIAFNLGMEWIIYQNLRLNFRFTNSLLPIREHASGATYLFNQGQYNTAIYLTLRYFIGTSSSQ